MPDTATTVQGVCAGIGAIAVVTAAYITGKSKKPDQQALTNTNFITLMAQHQKLMDSNGEVLTKNVELRDTLAHRETTIMEQGKSIETMKARLDALEKLVPELHTKIEQHVAKILRLETAISDKDAEIERLSIIAAAASAGQSFVEGALAEARTTPILLLAEMPDGDMGE